MMYINVVLSAIAAGLITYTMFAHDDAWISPERIGLGMIGGSVILSIASQLAPAAINPFAIWYQWVWRTGLILFFSGRLFRLERHARNNNRAKDVASAHFAGKSRND